MPTSSRFLRLAALALAALLAATAPAQAERIFGPHYNPKTKSYFALIDLGYHGGGHWEKVNGMAGNYWHKNTRARLAVVPDRETHRFLVDKFARHIREPAWIGLRYFCDFRKLLWVNGKILERSPANVWHPKWHRSNVTCESAGLNYMPVTLVRTGSNVRWQATGQAKFFDMMVVEYPTGKP